MHLLTSVENIQDVTRSTTEHCKSSVTSRFIMIPRPRKFFFLKTGVCHFPIYRKRNALTLRIRLSNVIVFLASIVFMIMIFPSSGKDFMITLSFKIFVICSTLVRLATSAVILLHLGWIPLNEAVMACSYLLLGYKPSLSFCMSVSVPATRWQGEKIVML